MSQMSESQEVMGASLNSQAAIRSQYVRQLSEATVQKVKQKSRSLKVRQVSEDQAEIKKIRKIL